MADTLNHDEWTNKDKYDYHPTTPDLTTPRIIDTSSDVDDLSLQPSQPVNLDTCRDRGDEFGEHQSEISTRNDARVDGKKITDDCSSNLNETNNFQTQGEGLSEHKSHMGHSEIDSRDASSESEIDTGGYRKTISSESTDALHDVLDPVNEERLFMRVQTERDIVESDSVSGIMSKSDVLIEDMLSLAEFEVDERRMLSGHDNGESLTEDGVSLSCSGAQSEEKADTVIEESKHCYENVAITDEEMMKNEAFCAAVERELPSVDSTNIEKESEFNQNITEEGKLDVKSGEKDGKKCLNDGNISTSVTTGMSAENKDGSSKTGQVAKLRLRPDRKEQCRPKSQPVFKSTEIPRPKRREDEMSVSALFVKKVNGAVSSESGLEDERSFSKGHIKSRNSSGSVSPATTPSGRMVRSKVGSLDNAKHTPGGGKVTIMSKKEDYSSVGSKVGSITNHKAGGGNVKIESKSVDYSNTKSRVGSLEKANHTPQGGNVKIENKRLDFKEKAQSKIGSKDNIKHTPGGGEKKIETKKLNFNNMAKSKVGSQDNAKHVAGGGTTKIATHKVDYSNVQSKCGSKDNEHHRAGGGTTKIETHKENYSGATSKIGSKDNAEHVAGGGGTKIEAHKENYSGATSKIGSKDNAEHVAGGGGTKIHDQKVDYTGVKSKCGSMDNAGHKAGGGTTKIKTEKQEW